MISLLPRTLVFASSCIALACCAQATPETDQQSPFTAVSMNVESIYANQFAVDFLAAATNRIQLFNEHNLTDTSAMGLVFARLKYLTAAYEGINYRPEVLNDNLWHIRDYINDVLNDDDVFLMCMNCESKSM